jgi:hypothetical protein
MADDGAHRAWRLEKGQIRRRSPAAVAIAKGRARHVSGDVKKTAGHAANRCVKAAPGRFRG